MGIDRQEVEHVARLARLALSEDEIELFRDQLGRILEHARRVTSLETEGIPPTSHAISMSNVFRADEVRPSLDRQEALRNAPEPENGYFRVPRITEGPEA